MTHTRKIDVHRGRFNSSTNTFKVDKKQQNKQIVFYEIDTHDFNRLLLCID